jgi:hypothetical protein
LVKFIPPNISAYKGSWAWRNFYPVKMFMYTVYSWHGTCIYMHVHTSRNCYFSTEFYQRI